MIEGTDNQSGSRRAFLALSFEEEKHLLLAEAHRALATRHRWQHLVSSGTGPDELACAWQKFDQLREELRESVLTAASSEVLADRKAMRAVLSVPELRRDCAVVGQILEVRPESWRYVDPEVFQDQDMTARIIKKHGWWLRYASPELRGDKEVVLAAVSSDPWALEFASAALRADKEVVLKAVSDHPSFVDNVHKSNYYITDGVLSFASADLRNDKEVVLAAVASDALDLEYASEALKGDREVVLRALKRQTREDVFYSGYENMLGHASLALRADREVVLEAVRVDVWALTLASMDLRQDMDFALQTFRKASCDEREFCYHTASMSLVQETSLETFLGAADSRIALAGEAVPVLSVSLVSAHQSHKKRLRMKSKISSISVSSCEVSLLSGASFTCSFTDTSCEDIGNSEPAPKRPKSDSPILETPRTAVPEQPQTCSTVGQLADMLLAELPRHVQMNPPLPERIFIVFITNGMDADPVPATPWDWNRPLSDFV